MPGARIGDGCILGEGTLVPAGAVIPPSTVLVGRPPHAIRSATDADRERLAVLREHQTDLTDFPGHPRTAALQAGAHMGTLYAYRDKEPVLGAGTVLFDSAEITGDVVVGEDTLIGAGVKIIGDSHGPVRIGSRVQILENAVLHLLPDNELVIEDDVVIGPGAMIHGCTIGRGTVVESAPIVCDFSTVGPESIVRAGACVKQRDTHPARTVLDGFPPERWRPSTLHLGRPGWGPAPARGRHHPPRRPLIPPTPWRRREPHGRVRPVVHRQAEPGGLPVDVRGGRRGLRHSAGGGAGPVARRAGQHPHLPAERLRLLPRPARAPRGEERRDPATARRPPRVAGRGPVLTDGGSRVGPRRDHHHAA